MKRFSIARWARAAAITIATLLSTPGGARALQVQPVIFDMSSTGSGTRQSITVVNSASKPVPMELKVNRLDLGPHGEMIKSPGGEDDFLIFPPQTIVPAHSTQTFRIQWVGDPAIAESRSYNILVNQIPVEVPESGSGKGKLSLQIVYSFVTTVTVRPPAGEASFRLRNAKAETNKEGKYGIALTIENTGNLHNYLANADVAVEAGNWSKDLSPQTVRALAGPGLILPHHTRTIFIPLEDMPKNPGSVSAEVRFKN